MLSHSHQKLTNRILTQKQQTPQAVQQRSDCVADTCCKQAIKKFSFINLLCRKQKVKGAACRSCLVHTEFLLACQHKILLHDCWPLSTQAQTHLIPSVLCRQDTRKAKQLLHLNPSRLHNSTASRPLVQPVLQSQQSLGLGILQASQPCPCLLGSHCNIR